MRLIHNFASFFAFSFMGSYFLHPNITKVEFICIFLIFFPHFFLSYSSSPTFFFVFSNIGVNS
uniref:Uncharacterized protein n=1 Tax=Rhizophora mucronata TaxID=61149 RepID=A0A2P2M8X2_RHIMU